MVLRQIKAILLAFTCFITVNLLSQQTPPQIPYVLLISIDGYRYDYTKKYQPTFLSKLEKKGLSAKSLIPTYPSKTFPNHLSMITGSYSEDHGIVANMFYHKKSFRRFSLRSKKEKYNPDWYEKDPIWIPLEQKGIKTASFFWPSSDVLLSNTRPSYYLEYDGRIKNEKRVQQVLEWFQLEEHLRPHFVSLYFSDVDHAGHKYGPNSSQLKEAVSYIDSILENLVVKLKELPLDIDIIFVSDHGMQEVNNNHLFYLSDYIDLKKVPYIAGEGSVSYLYFTEQNNVHHVYTKLKECPYIRVYKKQEIPEYYHLRNATNMGDILIDVRSPYYMLMHRDAKIRVKGEHGYNPHEEKNMHGIFYAVGPNFEENKVIPSFENIYVYSILKRIFNLN